MPPPRIHPGDNSAQGQHAAEGHTEQQPHILAEQPRSGAFRVLVAMETLLQALVLASTVCAAVGAMLRGDTRGWGSAGPHAWGGHGVHPWGFFRGRKAIVVWYCPLGGQEKLQEDPSGVSLHCSQFPIAVGFGVSQLSLGLFLLPLSHQ